MKTKNFVKPKNETDKNVKGFWNGMKKKILEKLKNNKEVKNNGN